VAHNSRARELTSVAASEGTQINTSAPVVVCNEIVAHAPIDTVWRTLTDVSRWSEWLPDVTRARLALPLRPGAVLEWEVSGQAMPSVVVEVVPFRRLAWAGPMAGVLAIQVWTMTESRMGVVVRSEESWEGAALANHAPRVQRDLEKSLLSWLRRLKMRVESTLCAPALNLTIES